MGTLYLVATPIGNLEDLTFRALRILNEVSLIAAEDTRQTQKLLDRYAIHTHTISYHEHSKISRLDEIIRRLEDGDVALVSDAGMPGINDPGYELVKATLSAGYPVSPVPGPSAPISALAASGLPTDAFLYLGYLPRRRVDRRQMLSRIKDFPYTLIFLEVPHRLREALEDLAVVLGNRPAAVARELTKLHEEIIRASIADLCLYFQSNEPRGEFTLVIGGGEGVSPVWDEEQVDEALRNGLAAGESTAEITERVARGSGWRKNQIYRKVIALGKS